MLSADRIYERRWALTLLEQVLTRLQEEYRVAGNEMLFDALKELLADEPDRRSQADIAQELRHDGKRGEAGVSSLAQALSGIVMRRDRSHSCGARRR